MCYRPLRPPSFPSLHRALLEGGAAQQAAPPPNSSWAGSRGAAAVAVSGAANPDAVSLLQFKNGLKGANLTILSSWTCDTDSPCGQSRWRWITCRGGRVVSL